ncbi:MAG: hypothetical protein BGN92_11250 [Sphingobacteriales bacterium 41-5]|nr:MAG: hypothetical protein BGN92_11250 [Sphingobacteriales bacterium 41-5]
MRTNQNTRSVVLGIFIIVALIIFALGLFVMGGQQRTFGKTINIKSVFSDVSGVKKGSNVLFAGVKVGIVKSISLQPGNKVLVEMQIENDAQKLIPKNAVITIGSDGMIGSKVLEINGGNLQAGYIQDGNVLQTEQGSSMKDMFAMLQLNGDNLLEITGDLKQISRKVLNGEGSVGKLINDPALANNLQALLNKLQVSADNAQTLTKDIVAFTSKLERPGTMTYNVVNDTVIFNRLRSTSKQLDVMASNAQVIVNKLNTTADKLNDTDKPAGMMLNDSETADDLKKVISNLETGTQKLNETLDALRHNFLLRGSFKKMERERAKDSVQ